MLGRVISAAVVAGAGTDVGSAAVASTWRSSSAVPETGATTNAATPTSATAVGASTLAWPRRGQAPLRTGCSSTRNDTSARASVASSAHHVDQPWFSNTRYSGQW